VFANKLHYCLLEIAPGECKLTAVDVDGNSIDTRTWPRR
jgi:hypothetical protein